MWFIGDLTNFFGSAWADLVPTVIALAIYFCFADAILISQCLYYNIINNRKAQRELSANINSPNEALPDDPTQPLLRRLSNGDNIGLPGSRRRSSTSMKRRSSNLQSPLLPTIDEEESSTKIWMKNASAVVGICLIGTAGWAAADWAGWWVPTPRGEDSGEAPRILGAEVLGYVSAVCYLGYVVYSYGLCCGIESVILIDILEQGFLKYSKIIKRNRVKVMLRSCKPSECV